MDAKIVQLVLAILPIIPVFVIQILQDRFVKQKLVSKYSMIRIVKDFEFRSVKSFTNNTYTRVWQSGQYTFFFVMRLY